MELLKVIAHLGRNRFSHERFPLLQLTHPGVHEDEIHLREGEDELEDGVHPPDSLVARRIPGNLKPRAELQSNVDHGAQAERWREDRIMYRRTTKLFKREGGRAGEINKKEIPDISTAKL